MTTVPVLADERVTVTPTGMAFGDGMGFEDWLAIGEQLKAMERSVMWWIGDWLRHGERRWGEMYAQALDATDYSYQTLANAKYVAGCYDDFSFRKENLTFAHHLHAASLPSEQRRELLAEAEREGWSVRELKERINQTKNVIGLLPSDTTCAVADLEALRRRGIRFGTVYADPPWLYGNQGTRAATGNHYGGMTVEGIAALPISDLLADNAHLHLWTTNAFLFDARTIMEAWGFDYKSCFVWVKPQMGIGNYWRVSHEFLLLGVRGSAPFQDKSLMSWAKLSRGKHSAKPELIREMIERASPASRLELFGRQAVDGWAVWGNEVSRDIFTQSIPEVA